MTTGSHHPRRIEPGPGQESVWDYPRPPVVVPFDGRVRVTDGGFVLADTTSAMRVLETSQPPAFYLPATDVRLDLLVRSATTSWCEWKGQAQYWSLAAADGPLRPDVAWSYPAPNVGFEAIAGALAFYPQRVEACWVDDERVQPNEGSFYGGWITSRVVGPFKGGPGTQGW